MARDNITDKGSTIPEWAVVKDLDTLKVGYEVKVNGVETRITKLDLGISGNVIGFYTARDLFTNSNPKNFWGRNSHAGIDVWGKVVDDKPREGERKEFKVGKWYKCIAHCGGRIEEGEYYQLFKQQGGLLFHQDMYNYHLPNKFDINSESPYNPVTVSVTIIPTDVNSVIKHFNQQEETTMSNNTQRKTVTVNLIDRDSALDEKFALVATFGEFTTSKSSEALIRSIIIDPKNKVAELIAQHNEVRVKQTNKEIMERTGNKVTLEPVEESDLHWEIR
jgi:hypothetical protein